MDGSVKNSPCKECLETDDVLLQAEVDHLRKHLGERDDHIATIEAEFVKCSSKLNDLEEQITTWREKYERIYDSHKRVQKLNQVLEDKLLQMVDKMKNEKSLLTKDIATLSVRLAESKHNYSMLQKENERYKNDMNLAIQLLQCKPDNFVSHKLDNLPVDTQARVSQYVMSKTRTGSSTQSKNGNDLEHFDASEYEFNISASLMSKILEDSIQDTVTKHCDTCTCSSSHSKPFCYNDTYYSVGTQTMMSGEMKNSLCLHCNNDIRSVSNISMRSASPQSGVKLVNEKTSASITDPLYIVPHPVIPEDVSPFNALENLNTTNSVNSYKSTEKYNKEITPHKDVLPNNRDMNPGGISNINIDATVHHKLCDRTKPHVPSLKSANSLGGTEDLLLKDEPIMKTSKSAVDYQLKDKTDYRKSSLCSMGAVSRASSIAKSTTSTHKSNTQVGPGPRFCSLRMQAGSKNILLDNAQPDVPPVLYRRQNKCNDTPVLKDITDVDNFLNLDIKNENNIRNDAVVVESTLVDVHIDQNVKEPSNIVKNPINPVLMNVSSSPLQPLKTHTFSSNSEQNNNPSQIANGQINSVKEDNLLKDFEINAPKEPEINITCNDNAIRDTNKTETESSVNHDVKMFNFDKYEQHKSSSHYPRNLKKFDMTQLHSLENTKISKDFPPLNNIPKAENCSKANLSTIVNVYPNLTQTHLKVNNASKNVFTNEQSTSSLSSDDSAALLQKQQLLRVAEWVEQNIEQQNNYNDPSNVEEDLPLNVKRRENKLKLINDTLNELAVNMPHPVSKYSRTFRDEHNNWVQKNPLTVAPAVNNSDKIVKSLIKETVFPVEASDEHETKETAVSNAQVCYDLEKDIKDVLNRNGDKDITPEDLARMEYNVKKFLLSSPHWVNPEPIGRSRRTSSKTETDV